MTTAVFVKCDRCNGNGTIKCFSHVKAGVCFRCRLDKEALSAPGDYTAEVSFDGACIRVKGRVFIRMSELAKLSRHEKIAAAAREFITVDSERGPHGFSFIRLIALAQVSDPILRGRIFAALTARVSRDEAREVAALEAEFAGESAAKSASV